MDVTQQHEQALTARALTGLGRVPGVKVLGVTDPASPSFASKGGVIPYNLKGFMAHTAARRRMGEICTAAAQRVYGQR